MRKIYKTLVKKENNKFSKSEIARHPLILILASAILSYYIIPAINNISEKNKRIDEEKLKLANTIIDHHLEVDKSLNAVFVAFDLFYKDNKGVSNLRELNNLRSSKFVEMRNIYSKFDSNAWYWESHYAFRSRTLGLSEKEIDSLRVLFRTYEKLLVRSANLLDVIWTKTLRTNKLFSDSLDMLIKSAKDTLDVLSSKRNKEIKNIVQFLTIR